MKEKSPPPSKNLYAGSISILILLIHVIMYFRDFRMMQIDTWHHLIKPAFLYKDFLNSILYFHGNPPGASIINYIANKISFGHRYAFFEVIFPFLHCICFYLFYRVLIVKKINYRKVIAALIFLNPLIFVYFEFPMYCTYIFVTSCCLLFVWTSQDISDNKKLLYIALLLSFNCFVRSSWHIYIIALVLIPFFLKANNRYRIICLLIVTIPFMVYVKNYILFNRFISSSWIPMNLSRAHIPWACDCKTISNLYTFNSYKNYKTYITNDPLEQKYKDIPILNQDDYNNIIYFAAGDMYMKDLKKCFNLKWSLKQVLQGIFYFYRSPADYIFLKKRAGGILDDNVYFCYDFLNINENPNSELNSSSEKETYFKNLSPYTFLYIFVILYFIVNIKLLSANEKMIFILMVFYSGIYICTDFYESNRMRFEIEPFYYFFTVLAFNTIFNKVRPQNNKDADIIR